MVGRGLALWLLAFAVAGCAGRPVVTTRTPRTPPPARTGGPLGELISIHGYVGHHETYAPISGALVIVQCSCLQQGQREVMTGADGWYRFNRLPQGKHTVQVLYQNANVNKSMDVPPGADFRANFTIDPTAKFHISCDLGDRNSIFQSLMKDDCVARKYSPVGCRQEDNGRKRFVSPF